MLQIGKKENVVKFEMMEITIKWRTVEVWVIGNGDRKCDTYFPTTRT